MKKTVLSLIVIGLTLVGCASTPKETMPLDEAIEIAKEVAGMVDYYDHINSYARNLFIGENEFQGQCGDYALLFALKTGADLIAVNQNGAVNNGIYRIVREEKIPSLIEWANKNLPKDVNGNIQSCFLRNNDGIWYYHPKIGMYRIRFVKGYTPRISNTHVWNLLGDTEIDVTRLDTDGTWYPYM